MGVRLDEDDFLLASGELLQPARGSLVVSSSELAAREINAHKDGIVGSHSAQCPERTASECANLEDRL